MTLTTFRQKCFCGSGAFVVSSICALIVIILMTKSDINKQHQTGRPAHNLEHTSYIEDVASDVEYTTPIKISTMLKIHQTNYTKFNISELNDRDSPPAYLRHDSGHFRNRFKSNEAWDYRPRYRIFAFGHQLELDLHHDDEFIAPNYTINYNKWAPDNFSDYDHNKRVLRKCYYSGFVKGDENSAISVSLCNGMIGVIKTSNYTYYIEPAKPHHPSSFDKPTIDSFLHRIKRLPHHDFDNNYHQMGKHNSQQQHDDIDQEPTEITNEDDNPLYHHIINKRHILSYPEDNNQNTYFIKILVVADKSMVTFHQSKQVLEHYLLVLMSYAARLYKDPSIGNSLSLTVASIWMLEQQEFSNSNSQDMLRQFCEWQFNQSKRQQHASHDMALLLTRNQICRRNSTAECDTLGIAEVGAMCNPSSGCAIVKENGLSTSYTIAHEVGHVLNMPHDNTPSCAKYSYGGGASSSNLMTKVMNNGTEPISWSECSKHYVTDFLRSNRAKCLIDPPSTNYITPKFTRNLPGENFTVDRQCELELGHGYRLCTFANSIPCKMLWCTNDENIGCSSNQLPWADGTVCGHNLWCNQSECTSRKLLLPIAGGWGAWQPWSDCSRTCGGGIRHSIRLCNTPVPQNGGQYCSGYGAKYESCNTQQCPSDTPDFRSVQCARFNNNTRRFANLPPNVEWLPDYNLAAYDMCKLYCRPKHSNISYLLKEKVIDGTKCGLNSFDICIDGYCQKGGCDNILNSNITFDDCGVCGGDNSQCHNIIGSYNKIESGYRPVTHIPKGSFNLNIRQNANNDTNYLVLKDLDSGDYILNSETMISPRGKDFIFGDVNISYSGASASFEWIKTPRNHKLTKPLELGVLSVGDPPQPPNITFAYTMNQNNAPRFGWWLLQASYEWTQCDAECMGQQYIHPICVDLVNRDEVEEYLCDAKERNNYQQRQTCNEHCQFQWHPANYSACSANCGKGLQKIYYKCVKIHKYTNQEEVTHEQNCHSQHKPEEYKTCYGQYCDSTRWEYTEWSECSATCGGGYQQRTAYCVDSDGRQINALHCEKQQVTSVRQECNQQKCPKWGGKTWSSCNASCYQSTKYYCISDGMIMNDSNCGAPAPPIETRKCFDHACRRQVQWQVGDWSKCNAKCNSQGVQRRTVKCLIDNKQYGDDAACGNILRPSETKLCKGSGECKRHLVPAYKWQEECSCEMARRFTCRNLADDAQVNELFCKHLDKPKIVCPPCASKWVSAEWSKCDYNCFKSRLVNCQNAQGLYVDAKHCKHAKKPLEIVRCNANECKKYAMRVKWKARPWKRCSTSCGRGRKTRFLECQDTVTNVTLVDQYCQHLKKPRTFKKCERYNCSLVWVEGPWTQCSQSCGRGYRHRNVTCHQVYQRRIVNPEPLEMRRENYCNLYDKPETLMECQEQHCNDLFVWKTGPWSECTQKCGFQGRQWRDVYCWDTRFLQRVSKNKCVGMVKPRRRVKCNQWHCLCGNCKEVQRKTGSRTNGEYVLSIGKRSARIYCYKMDTGEPEEFISFESDAVNWAEMYDRRLIDLSQCPYNGQRNERCECVDVGPERSGWTMFWKVRLNITSLRIIGDDFTFSQQRRNGTKVAYGTAGDCYSGVEGCTQGRFSIDLHKTSFKLAKSVRWTKIGNNATVQADFIDRQRVVGRCGGYCGSCVPDLGVGLQVEVT